MSIYPIIESIVKYNCLPRTLKILEIGMRYFHDIDEIPESIEKIRMPRKILRFS